MLREADTERCISLANDELLEADVSATLGESVQATAILEGDHEFVFKVVVSLSRSRVLNSDLHEKFHLRVGGGMAGCEASCTIVDRESFAR